MESMNLNQSPKDVKMGGPTCGKSHRWTEPRIEMRGQKDGQMDVCTDVWTYEWTDERIDRWKDKSSNRKGYENGRR